MESPAFIGTPIAIEQPVAWQETFPSKEFCHELELNRWQLEKITGKVKESWGKLMVSDLTIVAGKRDQLTGLARQRYGYEKDKAEKDLDGFMRAR